MSKFRPFLLVAFVLVLAGVGSIKAQIAPGDPSPACTVVSDDEGETTLCIAAPGSQTCSVQTLCTDIFTGRLTGSVSCSGTSCSRNSNSVTCNGVTTHC